jgi:hypothetical protein
VQYGTPSAAPCPNDARAGSGCSCDGTHSAFSAYVPAPATVLPTPQM